MKDFRALICINTCNRIDLLKYYSEAYYRFALRNPQYDFVASLDGKEDSYLQFFEEHKIPAIYSDDRQGIGIAKNRVLDALPNYDYYFFIEDDTELLNEDFFDQQIEICRETGIHHFSAFDPVRIRDRKGESQSLGKHIIHSMHGSAQVNFFQGDALRTVGGWHTEFAKYKRFGHTEHSYRFVNAGLMKYPFNMVDEFIHGFFDFHDPPTVSNTKFELNPETKVALVEEEIMKNKLNHFPVETMGEYHQMHLNDWRKEAKGDAFMSAAERRRFRSNLLFHEGNRFLFRNNPKGRIMVWQSILLDPFGPRAITKWKTWLKSVF
jgi:hypothetical protein